MDKNKFPLSIYVLYDTVNEDAIKLYEHIYSALCRDVDKPLLYGRGIPVYIRVDKTDKEIEEIDFISSEKTVVLILVDIHMYNSEKWENYVKNLIAKQNANSDKIFILPIIMYKYGIDFAEIQKINCIKYSDYNVFNHLLDFDIRLYNFVVRCLENDCKERLQIFISHAKKDGEEYAMSLRAYLASETKFEYFFDANNIQDGETFSDVIGKGASNSFLIIINTDSYSERDWCQREIVYAKENNRPIIVIDFIKEVVERSFPYLGNVPWIKYTNDWKPIVKALLQCALDISYQKQYLEYVLTTIKKSKNIDIFPCMPELFSVSKTKKTQIIYPEPPLGITEYNLLKKRYPKISFYTPIEYPNTDKEVLKNKKIAFSISDSSDYALTRALSIKDISLELFRHIVFNGASIIYGGDLRKNGYTQHFYELAKVYKEFDSSNNSDPNVFNYIAWNTMYISDEDKAKFKHNGVKLVECKKPKEYVGKDNHKLLTDSTLEDNYLYTKSLNQMRLERNEASDALIVVGGKTFGYHGVCPGTLEELLLATKKRIPIYVLGGFGGMSAIIAKIFDKKIISSEFCKLVENDSRKEFIAYYNAHSVEKFNAEEIFSRLLDAKDLINVGLSSSEKKILFYSDNVMELVQLVIKALKKYFANKEKR